MTCWAHISAARWRDKARLEIDISRLSAELKIFMHVSTASSTWLLAGQPSIKPKEQSQIVISAGFEPYTYRNTVKAMRALTMKYIWLRLKARFYMTKIMLTPNL
jgi:hypothetical protein